MSQQYSRIAEFIARPGVPASARDRVSLLLTDTIGVAAGATHLEPSEIARRHAVRFHRAADPADSAPMLFDGRMVSVPASAYAAATQIDNLDAHDGFNPVKGHIGCAVVPALFAFAAARPNLTARDALDILAMSYEISARAGLALHASVSDYHTSGAWNALGVAAIGCRLRDADATQTREALGIAEYHGPRSQMMREIETPTMLHDGSGMGAFTGAMAALLALDGFQGAPAITVEAPDIREYWDDLGTRWTLEENYIKPYPVCRWAHAPLDGLRAVMHRHDLAHTDISAIDVHTFAEGAALYPGLPETTGQAQYSMHFALSVLMCYGQVGPEHISGPGLHDPDVAALIRRITVHEDTGHNARFPQRRTAEVVVTLNDGTTLRSGVTDARGGPDTWLPEAEYEEKFMQFCAPVTGDARAARLWNMRMRMVDEGDMLFSDLVDLVTQPVPPRN
ncbi:MmgE/PrpD family protein [uncultured Roseobacter sp.]|uniref:MmgE/PrpD family protein n=1 Tax=uncultured Roseobacter sp. TaxID=114847 RepID=UPI00261B4918|nr:MmgE/PrpD family protein [uncultured Roseobacter sp.]